jgi:hypothetical protein
MSSGFEKKGDEFNSEPVSLPQLSHGIQPSWHDAIFQIFDNFFPLASIELFTLILAISTRVATPNNFWTDYDRDMRFGPCVFW